MDNLLVFNKRIFLKELNELTDGEEVLVITKYKVPQIDIHIFKKSYTKDKLNALVDNDNNYWVVKSGVLEDIEIYTRKEID